MVAANIYISRRRLICLLSLPEALQDQQVGLTHASFKLLPLCWKSYYVKFCLNPLRVESLLPTAFWLSHMQALLAFKVRGSGGSSSWCRTPGLGSPMSYLNPSFLVENLCNCGYLPVCVSANLGVWVLTIPYLFPSHLSWCDCLFTSLVV